MSTNGKHSTGKGATAGRSSSASSVAPSHALVAPPSAASPHSSTSSEDHLPSFLSSLFVRLVESPSRDVRTAAAHLLRQTVRQYPMILTENVQTNSPNTAVVSTSKQHRSNQQQSPSSSSHHDIFLRIVIWSILREEESSQIQTQSRRGGGGGDGDTSQSAREETIENLSEITRVYIDIIKVVAGNWINATSGSTISSSSAAAQTLVNLITSFTSHQIQMDEDTSPWSSSTATIDGNTLGSRTRKIVRRRIGVDNTSSQNDLLSSSTIAASPLSHLDHILLSACEFAPIVSNEFVMEVLDGILRSLEGGGGGGGNHQQYHSPSTIARQLRLLRVCILQLCSSSSASSNDNILSSSVQEKLSEILMWEINGGSGGTGQQQENETENKRSSSSRNHRASSLSSHPSSTSSSSSSSSSIILSLFTSLPPLIRSHLDSSFLMSVLEYMSCVLQAGVSVSSQGGYHSHHSHHHHHNVNQVMNVTEANVKQVLACIAVFPWSAVDSSSSASSSSSSSSITLLSLLHSTIPYLLHPSSSLRISLLTLLSSSSHIQLWTTTGAAQQSRCVSELVVAMMFTVLGEENNVCLKLAYDGLINLLEQMNLIFGGGGGKQKRGWKDVLIEYLKTQRKRVIGSDADNEKEDEKTNGRKRNRTLISSVPSTTYSRLYFYDHLCRLITSCSSDASQIGVRAIKSLILPEKGVSVFQEVSDRMVSVVGNTNSNDHSLSSSSTLPHSPLLLCLLHTHSSSLIRGKYPILSRLSSAALFSGGRGGGGGGNGSSVTTMQLSDKTERNVWLHAVKRACILPALLLSSTNNTNNTMLPHPTINSPLLQDILKQISSLILSSISTENEVGYYLLSILVPYQLPHGLNSHLLTTYLTSSILKLTHKSTSIKTRRYILLWIEAALVVEPEWIVRGGGGGGAGNGRKESSGASSSSSSTSTGGGGLLEQLRCVVRETLCRVGGGGGAGSSVGGTTSTTSFSSASLNSQIELITRVYCLIIYTETKYATTTTTSSDSSSTTSNENGGRRMSESMRMGGTNVAPSASSIVLTYLTADLITLSYLSLPSTTNSASTTSSSTNSTTTRDTSLLSSDPLLRSLTNSQLLHIALSTIQAFGCFLSTERKEVIKVIDLLAEFLSHPLSSIRYRIVEALNIQMSHLHYQLLSTALPLTPQENRIMRRAKWLMLPLHGDETTEVREEMKKSMVAWPIPKSTDEETGGNGNTKSEASPNGRIQSSIEKIVSRVMHADKRERGEDEVDQVDVTSSFAGTSFQIPPNTPVPSHVLTLLQQVDSEEPYYLRDEEDDGEGGNTKKKSSSSSLSTPITINASFFLSLRSLIHTRLGSPSGSSNSSEHGIGPPFGFSGDDPSYVRMVEEMIYQFTKGVMMKSVGGDMSTSHSSSSSIASCTALVLSEFMLHITLTTSQVHSLLKTLLMLLSTDLTAETRQLVFSVVLGLQSVCIAYAMSLTSPSHSISNHFLTWSQHPLITIIDYIIGLHPKEVRDGHVFLLRNLVREEKLGMRGGGGNGGSGDGTIDTSSSSGPLSTPRLNSLLTLLLSVLQSSSSSSTSQLSLLGSQLIFEIFSLLCTKLDQSQVQTVIQYMYSLLENESGSDFHSSVGRQLRSLFNTLPTGHPMLEMFLEGLEDDIRSEEKRKRIRACTILSIIHTRLPSEIQTRSYVLRLLADYDPAVKLHVLMILLDCEVGLGLENLIGEEVQKRLESASVRGEQQDAASTDSSSHLRMRDALISLDERTDEEVISLLREVNMKYEDMFGSDSDEEDSVGGKRKNQVNNKKISSSSNISTTADDTLRDLVKSSQLVSSLLHNPNTNHNSRPDTTTSKRPATAFDFSSHLESSMLTAATPRHGNIGLSASGNGGPSNSLDTVSEIDITTLPSFSSHVTSAYRSHCVAECRAKWWLMVVSEMNPQQQHEDDDQDTKLVQAVLKQIMLDQRMSESSSSSSSHIHPLSTSTESTVSTPDSVSGSSSSKQGTTPYLSLTAVLNELLVSIESDGGSGEGKEKDISNGIKKSTASPISSRIHSLHVLMHLLRGVYHASLGFSRAVSGNGASLREQHPKSSFMSAFTPSLNLTPSQCSQLRSHLLSILSRLQSTLNGIQHRCDMIRRESFSLLGKMRQQKVTKIGGKEWWKKSLDVRMHASCANVSQSQQQQQQYQQEEKESTTTPTSTPPSLLHTTTTQSQLTSLHTLHTSLSQQTQLLFPLIELHSVLLKEVLSMWVTVARGVVDVNASTSNGKKAEAGADEMKQVEEDVKMSGMTAYSTHLLTAFQWLTSQLKSSSSSTSSSTSTTYVSSTSSLSTSPSAGSSPHRGIRSQLIDGIVALVHARSKHHSSATQTRTSTTKANPLIVHLQTFMKEHPQQLQQDKFLHPTQQTHSHNDASQVDRVIDAFVAAWKK